MSALHCIRPMPFLLALACAIFHLPDAISAEDQPAGRGDLIIVLGSSGTEEYQKQFDDWAGKWTVAAEKGQLTIHQIGGDQDVDTLQKLGTALKEMSAEKRLPLWLVLIGHGTFDGKSALFNIPGPDLEPAALKECLASVTRPVCVINCSSASGPFLVPLAAPHRVIITGTNSGNEVNFARFGGYLASAITDPAADLDKDDQVSLLEAFLRAARLTEEFYEGEGRLPTEHALLDDNGDGKPVPLSGFDGLLPVQRNDAQDKFSDGTSAQQWAVVASDRNRSLPVEVALRCNEIELEIFQLRSKRATMNEADYFSKLERLSLEMARLLLPKPADPSSTEAPR